MEVPLVYNDMFGGCVIIPVRIVEPKWLSFHLVGSGAISQRSTRYVDESPWCVHPEIGTFGIVEGYILIPLRMMPS